MLLHAQATAGWLRLAGASVDLRSQAAGLTHHVAQQRDTQGAVRVGAELHPEAFLPPLGQAYYWVTYARALSRARGHQDDAVAALRRAEQITPYRLYRDLFVTGLIAELIARSQEDPRSSKVCELARRMGLFG